MPRESLDAPEDLPKEALRQVAVGQLDDGATSPPAALKRGSKRASERKSK
jgi:hypothetical protein